MRVLNLEVLAHREDNGNWNRDHAGENRAADVWERPG